MNRQQWEIRNDITYAKQASYGIQDTQINMAFQKIYEVIDNMLDTLQQQPTNLIPSSGVVTRSEMSAVQVQVDKLSHTLANLVIQYNAFVTDTITRQNNLADELEKMRRIYETMMEKAGK